MIRGPPKPTLFPYTTLFRAVPAVEAEHPRLEARREDGLHQGLARLEVLAADGHAVVLGQLHEDRKSTRLNSSHANISYAVFCLKKTHCREIDHRVEDAQHQH